MTLLEALRDQLVADGVVRVPRVAGRAPPMWLQPRDGVPAPGDGSGAEVGPGAVLAAFIGGGIPSRPYESALRRRIVDIHLRTTTASTALAIDDQLSSSLLDRRNWDMGGMRIVESQHWHVLQRLESGPQGFTFVVSFLFETYPTA